MNDEWKLQTMRASTTQFKPLASLAAAALIGLLGSVPTLTSAKPISANCGFTRALKTIKAVEAVRSHHCDQESRYRSTKLAPLAEALKS
jgi:hypothetical protein